MNLDVLDRYGPLLGKRRPSVTLALEALVGRAAPRIVELGASRSFVPGGRPGAFDPDPRWWRPDDPTAWDWGAGTFSRVCAEAIAGTAGTLDVVDPSDDAITIARTVTAGVEATVRFHRTTSDRFLPTVDGPIDLLYMDHHETCPEGAEVHRADTRWLLDHDVLADDAVILVDDVHVHSRVVERAGAAVGRLAGRPPLPRGKGTHSIPLLVEAGFSIAHEGYQVVLTRR